MNHVLTLCTYLFKATIFILSIIQSAYCQDFTKANYKLISLKDGLPNNDITCVFKDSDGIYWIGTSNGLARWDGCNFYIFRKDRSKYSILDNRINSIVEDNDKNIYVGSESGISIIQLKNGTVHKISREYDQSGLKMGKMVKFYKNSFGQIFIYGYGKFYELKKFTPIEYHFQIKPNQVMRKFNSIENVFCMNEDSIGNTYVLNLVGAMKVDTMSKKVIGSPKTYHDGKFIEDEVVSSIKLDDEILCGLWYVRNDVGLIKFNPYNNVFTPVNFKYRVYNILKLNDTIVLLNTNSGIWRYHFRKNIFEKVNLYNIPFFKFNEIDRIGSLFNFGSEELLFGTNKGLLIVDFKSTLVKKIASIFDFETSPNLLRSFPRCIYETDSSYIISWFEYIHYTQYYKNWKPTVKNSILDSLGCIFQLKQIGSDLYCSLNHDLRILDPTNFNKSKSIFSQSEHTLAKFKIRELLQKSKNELWFRCFDNGIFSFDLNKKIITSSHSGNSDNPEGLYGGSYYVMKNDKCGKLIVGTPGGISYYNESTCSFKKYYLPKKNTFVSDVDFDNFGNYWIAAGSHIVRFNPNTNEADYIRDTTLNADYDFSKIIVYDDSTIVSRHELGLVIYFPYSRKFIDVTDRDGFEILNEDFGIFYLARNKHIICGSYGTLYDVNIEELCQKRFKGICKISLVRTASRDIFCKFDSPLSFGYNENDITIFFSSQGYNSKTFDQYYYSINNEIQFKPLRSGKLELYNLNPGKYNIRLRIKNDQFIQDYHDANLELNILPAWYASLWFRIILALLLFYLFYWLFQNWKNRMLLHYKMEVEKKQALDEERQRIARDMHDDLGSSLSALSLISSNLQNSLTIVDQNNKKDLTRIYSISERLNQNIREIIWTTNSSNDNLEALVLYLERLCYETREFTGRKIKVHRPIEIKNIEISSVARKMIYLVCKEAIHNALKHTKGSINIKIEKLKIKTYSFVIEDEGPGFDIENVNMKTGSGLHNFQHRVSCIPKAQVNISSSPSTYTIIELQVKFD